MQLLTSAVFSSTLTIAYSTVILLQSSTSVHSVAGDLEGQADVLHKQVLTQTVSNLPAQPEVGAALASAGGAVPGTTFGPHRCVSLASSEKGTCIISTQCSSTDLSGVEFAFVCYNPDSTMPHTLHSFGRGGFAPVESYDTGVECNLCQSVEYALQSGGRVLPGNVDLAAAGRAGYQAVSLDKYGGKSTETAFYGPEACIATFLSPQSTCMIQTRCKEVNLAAYTVGVTCLDPTGDYTRYIFGKDTFLPEETFDTLIQCSACIGSGDRYPRQVTGVLPKNLVQDVNVLKSEVKFLRQNLNAMSTALAKSRQDNSTNETDSAEAEKLAKAPSPDDQPVPWPPLAKSTLASAPSPGTRSSTAGTRSAHAQQPEANLAPAPSLASAPSAALPDASFLRAAAVAQPPIGFAPAPAQRAAGQEGLTVRELLRQFAH